MEKQLDKKIQTLAQWLYESRHTVVFTGAGISTESGLPDFRGPDGVWTRRDKGLPPRPMSKPWDKVNPNSGHYAIVELQKLGKLRFHESIGNVLPPVIKRLKRLMGFFE